MGGKGTILLVLAFSTLFLVFGHRLNWVSTDSVENLSKYYVNNKAHNIAVSAANIAANMVFMDKTWDGAGYEDIPFDGGSYTLYVSNPLAMSGTKIDICHIPPGNHSARHTITVSPSAVPAHLAHGDYLGSCDAAPTDYSVVSIIAEGTFGDSVKTVYVDLRPSNFAKFGNFYSTISASPATGDTFHGPFHTNGKLKTYGTPVFWGKVTAKRGLSKRGSPKDPKFYGGYESGVDIPMEFDTTGMHTAAFTNGRVFKDTTNTNKKTTVEMNFLADGNVEYKYKLQGGPWSATQTEPLSSFAPNGVIYIERGDVRIKGTLNGKATVVASKKGKSGCGNIYQIDDLQYKDDPTVIGTSDDILGLVAEENIRIEYNADTKHHDIITQASMFALNGSIGPDNQLISNDGVLTSWKILGGLIANTTRVTAHYSGSTPYEGYKFVHRFDQRFMRAVPPHFPHTKNFEVVSWYE